MPCFYIPPTAQQLFANLIEPRRDTADAVVVLCYPFGQEYMRAHRSFRQLATLLSRAGVYSLRFDYPASGDSFGDQPITSCDVLFDSLERAVESARERSGKSTVYLCGLRFGGLLAASLLEHRDDIAGLFLWDSYATGKEFLAAAEQNAVCYSDAGQTWWVHGFPLTQALREDIAELDITNCTFKKQLRLHHIISHQNASSNHLRNAFGNLLQEHLSPSNGDWNYVDMEGSILMPNELIKTLSKVIANA